MLPHAFDSKGRTHTAKAELRGETSREGRAWRQQSWLTEAVACVMYATRGTVKRVAISLAVPESQVYETSDINDPRPLKAGWIPTIVRETGSFAILDAIEAQVGRVAFRIPESTNPDYADVVTHAAQTMREVAEAISAISSAVIDGRITDAERVQIEKQIAEGHAALAMLNSVVAKKAVAA